MIHLDKQENDPGRNGRVGDIEGRPMILVPVQVDKVYDFAHADAVEQVPQGPAQNQGKAHERGLVLGAQAPEEVGNASNGHGGYKREKDRPQGGAVSGEKAESRACVPKVSNIDKVGDDLDGVIKGHPLVDPEFGDLV